jgi:hypothetical protein
MPVQNLPFMVCFEPVSAPRRTLLHTVVLFYTDPAKTLHGARNESALWATDIPESGRAVPSVPSCHTKTRNSRYEHSVRETACAFNERREPPRVQGSPAARHQRRCGKRARCAARSVAAADTAASHTLAPDADASDRYGRAFLIRCASFPSTVPGPTSSTSVTP